MPIKVYQNIKIILSLIFILILIFSIYFNHMFLVFLSLGFYMALVSFLKIFVKGVIADERQKMVAEKASQISFQILMPLLLLTTVALIASAGQQEFYYLNALGTILAYITCLGLIIYLLAFFYFNKKTGGQ